MRQVSHLELVNADYADMAKLATIFNHVVIENEHGTWRWKKNRLMDFIENNISLNELVIALHRKHFSIEEFVKFNMQIGYSLSGFCELFDMFPASERGVDDAEGEETVVDYLLRKYDGIVLKI